MTLSFCIASQAQLKPKVTCDPFVVDILDGKVNDFKANAQMADIKAKFPCFTSTAPEGDAKCGGTIVYKDRDLIFYTDRDYVEVGPKFNGKLSIPLMGAARSSLFKWLGNPKLKDTGWDAYAMSYGTLVLHYDKAGKVNLIQFSTKDSSVLQLCE